MWPLIPWGEIDWSATAAMGSMLIALIAAGFTVFWSVRTEKKILERYRQSNFSAYADSVKRAVSDYGASARDFQNMGVHQSKPALWNKYNTAYTDLIFVLGSNPSEQLVNALDHIHGPLKQKNNRKMGYNTDDNSPDDPEPPAVTSEELSDRLLTLNTEINSMLDSLKGKRK
ncbi:MAG: hypothetical protein AAF950_08465 [Pseudomonadota bacterium]